jgi:predicted nucleic-acid-binding protein
VGYGKRWPVEKSEIFMCDTNYVIRYLVNDDPVLFEHAKDFFDEVYSGRREVRLLESVLVECVYVLEKFYTVPRAKIADTLIGFLNYKGVVCERKNDLAEALLFYKEGKLDIGDCILVAFSHSHRAALKSFDKALLKKYATVGKRRIETEG